MSLYLSKKPGLARYLKLFKYGPITGQVFGFCQRDSNLSFLYTNSKDVCFHVLYREDKCSLLFQENLLRSFISFDLEKEFP